jgi:hypothetical protein
MPSFAPKTAARSQPIRSVRCRSLWLLGILFLSLMIEVASIHFTSSTLGLVAVGIFEAASRRKHK